ncbi:NAD(P)/FAD-dependent oxidoreductase [Rhodococcus rhodochrous]|uniref:flavin-containing monooxygenase n=1 Tax=Rhodococcus rhodochrous TaxID=1829 RepID=UPI001E33BF64|nr:NAD(P)/FAD-dependent oxidoreductase [Rhodococcus rhodochrous]MCD2099822.1 NAD(P)/FAD-dependent oxidoreductase [Rhodococcus rhodochrous]MCD2124300.1 NAD(P)/FAD-dependent oxidoreductase [Rhodococcus rhodochrous]MCQ4137155.1 NAD(P)/FAD-dependent oxidoreductase [Rhodococcus rhodochrous]MDJ0020988.1 NAD(P)/FAD-dependent oxidoreductase [Rhodococcus rhodochrous]
MSPHSSSAVGLADTEVSLELDALIIGAGVAGLYQLHQLRELGLRVRAFDTASDVGGTWYWNRYPGARFDSEAYIYQYLFSDELYKNWSWSQRFPGQPEIEQWLHYVTDSLDLRRDIQFSTTITSAHYVEDSKRWIVRTDRGDTIATQFLITCAGMLSAPMSSVFEGQESFAGPIFHTSRWPKEGADVAGKRVAVIGVGATGIQVIQTIADKVEHLKVFIRTPQYALPMKNPSYDDRDVAAYKERFEELRATLPHTFSGFEYDFEHAWVDLTPEQRRERLEEIYDNGSLKLWLASFAEVFSDDEVSEQVSEFVREKMRARLKDPKLCELLIPTDYGFGTHRVPLETNYLEVYHRPNVEAVGVRTNPISRIVPEGILLKDGTLHEVDVIILATGFDAGSGALTRIDIRGREDRSLASDWSRDIRTTMGLMVHGYPNMLTTGAPLAPSAALCNMTTCLQQQTEWITECIRHMREHGYTVIEPTVEGEDEWVAHHDETANATLISKTNSWYNGANVPGKPRRVLSYTGGVGTYRELTLAAAAAGYKGFQLS